MTDKKIPAIGEYVRHLGKLVAIETIPPKPVPPEVDYIFEEIEAQCEVRLHGETFKYLHTNSDFYGYETGIKAAIEEMQTYCKDNRITKDSELEVVVIRVARQYRKRPIDHDTIFLDKRYMNFEALGNYQSERNLPEPVATVVWSSKNPEASPSTEK